MNIVLFDDATRHSLLPFTHTRPVADIRCGVFTMRERWAFYLGKDHTISTYTETYLQNVFPLTLTDDNTYVNAALFATPHLTELVLQLAPETALYDGDNTLLAARTAKQVPNRTAATESITAANKEVLPTVIKKLRNVWDIFSLNGQAITEDFAALVAGRMSAAIPEHVVVNERKNLFIEDGAIIHPCIINAKTGPVYIAKDAEIMEGSVIRGPFALGEHAVLKMGAKVYGSTTIGPGCKIGGEVSNLVMFANSNKGHDGFIGNAVIGEWCNLGADTNASNLKNNYDNVKIWDEHNGKLVKTGLQFCGLLMGDHSKCGINTMFNTGTVVGVSANIFGGGFPDKFVPSFTWGGINGSATYMLDKALETAERVMVRRDKKLTEEDKDVYQHIFDLTAQQRAAFSEA